MNVLGYIFFLYDMSFYASMIEKEVQGYKKEFASIVNKTLPKKLEYEKERCIVDYCQNNLSIRIPCTPCMLGDIDQGLFKANSGFWMYTNRDGKIYACMNLMSDGFIRFQDHVDVFMNFLRYCRDHNYHYWARATESQILNSIEPHMKDIYNEYIVYKKIKESSRVNNYGY